MLIVFIIICYNKNTEHLESRKCAVRWTLRKAANTDTAYFQTVNSPTVGITVVYHLHTATFIDLPINNRPVKPNLLALLAAHHILHVSRLRVKMIN